MFYLKSSGGKNPTRHHKHKPAKQNKQATNIQTTTIVAWKRALTMAIPLYLSVATIAISFLFPSEQSETSSSSSRSVVSSSTMGGDRSFAYGVALGMGLSVLISAGMRRKRVPERLRLALYSWLYDDENDKEGPLTKRLRKPTKVTDVEGKALGAEGGETDGVRRELLSPATALTSNLYVVVLTIPSGKELVAQKAQGVEFYYVIHGIGAFASRGSSSDISKGDGFVVDPGSVRGIASRGRGELVLLRATEVQTSFAKDYDTTRLDPNQQSATMAFFSSGLNTMESMAKTYKKKSSNETS